MKLYREILALSWPVITEKILRTFMRTTDIIVAGFLSPSAVAAVGLANLYSRLTLSVGIGLGGGAIALTSQDTGSGATGNRDQTITQALLIGVLAGIPFALFGFFLSRQAISILGASFDLAQMGGAYLFIVMLSSPARLVSLIGARSFQGIGDTKTPMYINVVANALNILGTIVLAFGLGPFPQLGVVGIAIATLVGDVFSAGALLLAIQSPKTPINFARPRDTRITRQLIRVSTPRTVEGFAELAGEFPLNAILLFFGTEVNAAYQIGRRVYQQLTSPFSRGFDVAASVQVGQSLGNGDPNAAYSRGLATSGLGFITVSGLSAIMFLGADSLAFLFTRDMVTIPYATNFIRSFAVAAPLAALFTILSGALRGASDTRASLIGRTTGNFFFLLGISYFFGLRLEFGVSAVYLAIVLDYAWSTIVVGLAFYNRNWIEKVLVMMEERGGLSKISKNPS